MVVKGSGRVILFFQISSRFVKNREEKGQILLTEFAKNFKHHNILDQHPFSKMIVVYIS